ncbi:hypothetical protein [Dactylosporangium sp. CS-033363]|uniref:hypothetical protein n=1 Tax=Dactylosporangium sp. CS-033363 TaxID=3239935 RepID=UPI003D918344
MEEREFLSVTIARLLAAHDRLDVLRAEAARGDWSCGVALGEELIRRGELHNALRVYRTFLEPARWGGAAERAIEVLEEVHGVERALEFVRPYADAGDRNAIRRLALVLGRQGRIDEVFALLRPHLTDWWLAEALVEATAGHGRDEEVIAALAPLADPEPWNVRLLLATVLERGARRGEAIDLLRGGAFGSTNEAERLAELLRREGREAELRDLMTVRGREEAAYALAALLEDQDRLPEAVDTLRAYADRGRVNPSLALGKLLHRHGRGEEAADVLTVAIRAEGTDHGCTRQQLWTMLIEDGRPGAALARLEDLEREFDPADLVWDRVWLLREVGRPEEALTLLRTRPDPADAIALRTEAHILTNLGRRDEAIAVLRAHVTAPYVAPVLAELLIEAGAIDDALAVLGRPPRTTNC